MDSGTANDHIEDLMLENRQLRQNLQRWKRIGTMAFTHAKGCLDGCRRACMCTCGYEHYFAQVREDKRNG
jgi:hypothetical protein